MLEVKGISLSNLCGFSTDGAAVMLGHKSDVVTRLKREVPGVLVTHCFVHRLALSWCTGADAIPYMVNVQEIINSVYQFFHNSPRTWPRLKQLSLSSQVKVPGLKKCSIPVGSVLRGLCPLWSAINLVWFLSFFRRSPESHWGFISHLPASSFSMLFIFFMMFWSLWQSCPICIRNRI